MKGFFNYDFLKITDKNELWKLEKNRFRPFVISSIFAFAFLFLIPLVSFILRLVFLDSIRNEFLKNGGKEVDFNQSYYLNLSSFGLFAIFALLALIFHIMGIISSYKKKNFSSLNQWPMMAFGVVSFFSVIQLVQTIFSGLATNSALGLTFTLFSVFSFIALILLYYLAVRPLRFVKNAFDGAAKLEELKKEFGDDIEVNGRLNLAKIFGFESDSFNEKTNDKFSNQKDEFANKTEYQEKLRKLLEMPNEKLFKAAEKLYIRGYQDMAKENLAKLILNILIQKESKDKNNKEEKDNNNKHNNQDEEDAQIIE